MIECVVHRKFGENQNFITTVPTHTKWYPKENFITTGYQLTLSCSLQVIGNCPRKLGLFLCKTQGLRKDHVGQVALAIRGILIRPVVASMSDLTFLHLCVCPGAR